MKKEDWVSVERIFKFSKSNDLNFPPIYPHDQFEKDGTYKFDKAAGEIKKKKLTTKMETDLLGAHEKCKGEAKEMFKAAAKKNSNQVDQVQFYQSCVSFPRP